MDWSYIFQLVMQATLTLALPTLIASMTIGLIISVFQAVTQLQDPTLSFIPKIILVFIVIYFSISAGFNELSNLTFDLFEIIGDVKNN